MPLTKVNGPSNLHLNYIFLTLLLNFMFIYFPTGLPQGEFNSTYPKLISVSALYLCRSTLPFTLILIITLPSPKKKKKELSCPLFCSSFLFQALPNAIKSVSRVVLESAPGSSSHHHSLGICHRILDLLTSRLIPLQSILQRALKRIFLKDKLFMSLYSLKGLCCFS